ncbi:MAG: hypothetical protein COU25_03050 [Candidatus Levybacteria bacterium CG10_big_fil_rev_8_21_14_0_10_35_13]|nr:MAG: hypothetical protein COU25_03050 [Candidatus Levybacteria bacterium CG10_big_fil_rev_8_21_14_0_10_35_13]
MAEKETSTSKLGNNLKNHLPKIFNIITSYRPKSYTPILALLLIIAAFLLGVLITKIQYLEKNQGFGGTISGNEGIPNTATGPQAGQIVDVEPGNLPVLGNKDAKVTIIEFADFQCPFCKRLFDETISQLKKEYVDTGKVKLYYRHFAFLGEESNWAAEASECANEQGKFWGFHDYLYTNQGGENVGAFSKDNLKTFAANLGLNTSQFNTCLDSGKYSQKVLDDVTAGQTAGVTGTPTLFINGTMLVGAEPYSNIKAQIEKALTE